MTKTIKTLLVATALLVAMAAPAYAQGTGIEIGTSLLNLTVNWGVGSGSQTATTFGIPTSGIGVTPGLYVSILAGSHVAIEPQLGLAFRTSGGNSAHALTVAGQFDYFVNGTDVSSPYLFASAGLLEASGSGPTPKSVSFGAGYRKLVGDRLAFRLDGRIVHFTDNVGNALVIGVSIGGVFGQR